MLTYRRLWGMGVAAGVLVVMLYARATAEPLADSEARGSWRGLAVSMDATPIDEIPSRDTLQLVALPRYRGIPDCRDIARTESRPCRLTESPTRAQIERRLGERTASAWGRGDRWAVAYRTSADSVTAVSVEGGVQLPLSPLAGTPYWALALRLPGLDSAVISLSFQLHAGDRAWVDTTALREWRGPQAPSRPPEVGPIRGSLRHDSLWSDALADFRRLTVYVPPHADHEDRLPVVYFADGESVDEYARLMDPMMAAGDLPGVVFVGIWGSGGEKLDPDAPPGPTNDLRTVEYHAGLASHPGVDSTAVARRYAGHREFFTREVREWAERTLPVRRSPRWRAVHGSSSGGAFALSLGRERPELFDLVIANSTGGAGALEGPESGWAHAPKHYLTVGRLEVPSLVRTASSLRDSLVEHDVPHVVRIHPSGHDPGVWLEELPGTLRWWLAGGARTEPREISNLRAFTRLYGYVRFFHPSDAAADLDWHRFAVHGASAVRGAETPDALGKTLETLFRPVAPTVDVYPVEAGGAGAAEPSEAARDTTIPIVAWQHVGVDLGARAPYRSVRIGRGGQAPRRRSVTGVEQDLDAKPYRGMEARFRAFARAEVRNGWGNRGGLRLAVTRADGSTAFEDRMADRPIMASRWRAYELRGPIAEDAGRIVVGAELRGEGVLRLDDVTLQVRREGDRWRDVPLTNPGFEVGATDDSVVGWRSEFQGRDVIRTSEDVRSGSHALRVAHERPPLPGPLFDARPEPGSTIEEALTEGLRCRVPLVLSSSRAEGGSGSARALRELQAALEAMDPGTWTGDDVDVRLGAVIVAWSSLQHFYPYFDESDSDWERGLTRALRGALRDTSASDFHVTLRRMIAALDDGHARVNWFGAPERGYLPLLLDRVDDRIVVVASRDSAVRRGDVVVTVDGTPAEEALRFEEHFVSGSPQWKRRWALRWELGAGPLGSRVPLLLEGADGRRTVRVERGEPRRQLTEPRPGAIAEVGPGLLYVDLTAVSMATIRERMGDLASARGLVFDVRGYPRGGNHRILRHLLAEPDTVDDWFRIPRVLYPNRERSAGYEPHGWELEPAEPHLDAPVAFLTDARAISYAEGLLSVVEHYGLGEIVGRPTAGANGNINTIHLPGLYQVPFTGLEVVRLDGSRFHGEGIQPTVPARPTLRAVREGRDAVLEAALRVLAHSDRAIGTEAPPSTFSGSHSLQ